MDVPTRQQIAKMGDRERTDLAGWIRTELADADRRRTRASQRADEAKGRLEAAQGEVREAQARREQLGDALHWIEVESAPKPEVVPNG